MDIDVMVRQLRELMTFKAKYERMLAQQHKDWSAEETVAEKHLQDEIHKPLPGGEAQSTQVHQHDVA